MKTESMIKPPQSKLLKSGRVILNPGEEIGEHITKNREEIIVILKGEVTIIDNGKSVSVKASDIHYIGENVPHNVINNSQKVVEYIYVVGIK